MTSRTYIQQNNLRTGIYDTATFVWHLTECQKFMIYKPRMSLGHQRSLTLIITGADKVWPVCLCRLQYSGGHPSTIVLLKANIIPLCQCWQCCLRQCNFPFCIHHFWSTTWGCSCFPAVGRMEQRRLLISNCEGDLNPSTGVFLCSSKLR